MNRFVRFAIAVFSLCPDLLAQTQIPIPTDKSIYNLFNPTPTNLMREFETDRPSKTDVPFTVDAGHFQIEADFVNFTQDANAGVRTQTFEAGDTLNVKVGLFNNVDFQTILGGYIHSDYLTESNHSRMTDQGMGDTTFRLKLNLLGNDSSNAALALLPYVKAPTDTGATGNHAWEGGLNVPFAMNLPWGFTLNAETGAGAFRNIDDKGYHPAFNNSAILYHAIYKALSGYGEFYSSVSTRSQDPWIGTVDFGLIYQVTPNLAFDVDTALGVTRSAPDYVFFCGVGVRF